MEKPKPNDNDLRTRTRTQNQTQTWGTWEELLLACAVKRHGFKDWDSVAMEVQTRTSLPPLLTTARNCELKFSDLKRRYTKLSHSHLNDNNDHQNDNGTLSPDNDDTVDRLLWLDELRKLRVAELRQQVQRSDVSILSLQLKVKRLEEERERSLKEEQESGENNKPDLEVSAGCRSENNEKPGKELNSIEPVRNDGGKPVRGDESDRDNQSVNESNSTGSRSENGEIGKVVREVKLEPEVVRVDNREPVTRGDKPVGGEYREGESVQPSEGNKVEDSSELRDLSADGELFVMKDSSEVQSSATLTRKRNKRRRKELSGGTSGEDQPENEEASVKSQPLAGVLEMIKGQEHSSLFERLIENQESEQYKKLVRQHLDLEKIQLKLREGYYSSCGLALFRDLLLLFNNAVLFFPEDSVESTAAHQLRRIVSNEIKAHIQNPPPKSPQHKHHSFERSESDASKHNSSAPILVCRKRSSIASKASSGSGGQQSDDSKKLCSDRKPPIKSSSSETAEETPTVDTKPKEKPKTGVRSFRRSAKNLINNVNSNSSKKPMVNSTGSKPGSANKSTETITKVADEKKLESTTSTEKKRSAADFLKRIKRNYPAETLKITGGAGSSSVGGRNSKTTSNSGKEQKKTNGNGKNDRGSKERILRNGGDRKGGNANFNPSKRNVGRPSKKGLEADAVSGKRARESISKEEATTKKPKKRAKR